jgi:hypothetical protein
LFSLRSFVCAGGRLVQLICLAALPIRLLIAARFSLE